MTKSGCGLSGMGDPPARPNISPIEFKIAKMEKTMWSNKMQIQHSSAASRVGKIGKGIVVAGAIAALSLAAVPTTAHARGGIGPGAAIGLGVLGGVLAGAAIASSVPPVYGAPPPPAYYYPPQPYQGYYTPAPGYYPAQQPYYGWTPY